MSAPLVSAIVAAYNYGDFLPRTLDSALAQDYPADRLEIVVVDDGSTDQTPEVVADYAASSERVEAILARLLASGTYVENLTGRPIDAHLSHAETMDAFLTHVDETYGGVEPMLAEFGWTADDTARLRDKLRSAAP